MKKTQEQPIPAMMESPQGPTIYEQFLLVAILIVGTGVIVVALGFLNNNLNDRQLLAKEICENLSLNYSGYTATTGTIECTYHYSSTQKYLNISTSNQTLYIQPDWDYYEGKKNGTAD